MRSLLLLALLSACGRGRLALGYDPLAALHKDRDYLYCRPELRAHGIDADAENAPAFREAERLAGTHRMTWDVILVPGYTPLDQVYAEQALHPITKERLLRAVIEFEQAHAPFILVSGGNVHPDNTPFNEALQMKRFLTDGGFPEERVFIEPCAQHSHTNLRNSARLMLSAGLTRAVITTSADQAMYFTRARTTTFELRQMTDFGYVVGMMSRLDEHRLNFVPYAQTFQLGPDEKDP